ncbi:unnamed protein product, partial [Porites evermanni]
MKFYNRDFHASASKIRGMLKKANLMGHGYQVEIEIKTEKKPGKPEYVEESRYYYKIVPCSKVPEIEEELNKLLSGAFGSELASELGKEIQVMRLGESGKCKTGVEI